MAGIEQKVRELLYIPETAQKQFQFRIDYLFAMMEFKNEHPNRQCLRSDYVAQEIASYLVENWYYERRALK